MLLEGYGKSSKAAGRVRSAHGPDTHRAESPKLLAVFQRLRLGGGRQSPRRKGCARDRPGGPPKVRGEVIAPSNYSGSSATPGCTYIATEIDDIIPVSQLGDVSREQLTDDNRQASSGAARHHVKTEAHPHRRVAGSPAAPCPNACTRPCRTPASPDSKQGGRRATRVTTPRRSGSTSSLRSIRPLPVRRSGCPSWRSPIRSRPRRCRPSAVVVAHLVGVDVDASDRCRRALSRAVRLRSRAPHAAAEHQPLLDDEGRWCDSCAVPIWLRYVAAERP